MSEHYSVLYCTTFSSRGTTSSSEGGNVILHSVRKLPKIDAKKKEGSVC